jgi:hypothetical protein
VSQEPNPDRELLSLKRRNLNDPMEQLVLKTVRAQVDLAMEMLAELLSHADELWKDLDLNSWRAWPLTTSGCRFPA